MIFYTKLMLTMNLDFSALDAESEQIVQAALDNVVKGNIDRLVTFYSNFYFCIFILNNFCNVLVTSYMYIPLLR